MSKQHACNLINDPFIGHLIQHQWICFPPYAQQIEDPTIKSNNSVQTLNKFIQQSSGVGRKLLNVYISVEISPKHLQDGDLLRVNWGGESSIAPFSCHISSSLRVLTVAPLQIIIRTLSPGNCKHTAVSDTRSIPQHQLQIRKIDKTIRQCINTVG